MQFPLSFPLIDLHYTIDLPDEPETGEEANTSGQQEKQENHKSRITEIEER